MASETRLISAGNVLYLAGPGIPYTGTGAPWTVQADSPFKLGMNDVTSNIYTPAPAPSAPIMGGGPPFRLGRSLITKSYDVVTESVGIQMYATSLDNAAQLLQLLRQVLNTTSFTAPCILAVQPNGSTNETYFEIYHADVAEMPDYLWENHSGFAVFRAAITWTRSIGFAGELTTVINGATMRNRSSGTPDDLETLDTLTGDLLYEGQPLNLKIDCTTNSFARVYLAAVDDRINTSVSNARTTSTSVAFTTATPTISDVRNRNLKVRILARFTTFTAPANIRLQAAVYDGGLGTNLLYLSPVLSLPAAGSTVSTLLDFGEVPIPTRSIYASTLSLNVVITLSSASGSVTATLDYVETLLYRTFALIGAAGLGNGVSLVVEAANDYTDNAVWVPNRTPRLYTIVTSTGLFLSPIAYRGTLPRAFDAGKLYLAWLKSASVTNDTHDTADTMVVTGDHLPLFHTIRGAG